MDILQVEKLTKRFGLQGKEFTAVDTISFKVKESEIVGLLGPNGAGKTTTIHMLLGITTPTEGEIVYFGKNFSNHRSVCLQRMNYSSAFNKLQYRISVWENLLTYAYLYNIKGREKKIKELAEYFELDSIIHKRFGDLSTGQQTRANIVKSLLNEPNMLLLDEPTASLDPDISDKLLTFIEEYRKKHTISILYTSHDMHEVTRLCDRVIFLDHGKIVAQDTPLGLTKRVQVAQLKLTFDEGKHLVQEYVTHQQLMHRFDGEHVVYITTEEKSIPKIIFSLSKIGIWMTDIEVKKPTLEHVFLQIARGEPYVFE